MIPSGNTHVDEGFVETSLDFIMAVRVLLLIACTGLFATAWSADRPAAASPRVAAETRHLPEPPSVTESSERSLVVAEVGRAISVSTELDVSLVSPPELIAPGTYRVVDAQGRVAWMSIPFDENPERSATEPQPVYSSESANGRWYFIRVEAAPVIASPLEGSTVLR